MHCLGWTLTAKTATLAAGGRGGQRRDNTEASGIFAATRPRQPAEAAPASQPTWSAAMLLRSRAGNRTPAGRATPLKNKSGDTRSPCLPGPSRVRKAAGHMEAMKAQRVERGEAAACRQEPEASRPADAPVVSSLSQADRLSLCAQLLRRQLERILRLVDPELGGQPVRPDSFRFRPAIATPHSGEARRPIRYEALPSYSRNEPRLEVIKHGLERALRLGEFMCEGQVLAADGFRLRHLAQWAHYPVGSLEDNIGSISSYCNCDCDFCYEKGTREAGIALGRVQLSLREVTTRLKHYSVEKQTGLVPSSRWSLEPFANPHCLEILERMHAAAPKQWINLTTSGSHLTEEVIARLAQLRPIMLSVSLNAASVETRAQAMRDRPPGSAENALASPGLLRKYEIPFVGSYVPWPSKPLSDMADMVRLLDRCDAVSARICLPSYTRYSHSTPPFDTRGYWAEILAACDRLREEVAIPIRPTPATYQLRTIRAVIAGTTKHSPAHQAGLRYGDLIMAIEGETVYTRPEVSRWLAKRFADTAVSSTRFTIGRQGKQLEVEVAHPRERESLCYPHYWLAQPDTPVGWVGGLGLHMADGPELTSFVRLKECVEEYPGKRVLLLISELMEPCFHEGMALLGEKASFVDTVSFHVAMPTCQFWGGNIMVGDLWTIQDLVEQTAAWMQATGLRPDVVIVPASFLNHGGRDLLGRCYLEFERELGIELRLLPCYRIVL